MEQIIKQEEGLQYKAGLLFKTKGALVLTRQSLSFVAKSKKLLEIPLSQIVSVNAQKGIGNGVDWLLITHKEGGKEKKSKIMHFGFFDGFGLGIASRLKGPYFAAWEKLIDDTRFGHQSNSGHMSAADELKKLNDLLKEGIISQSDFESQKKKLLA